MKGAATADERSLQVDRGAVAQRAEEAFAATRATKRQLKPLRSARPRVSTIEKDAEVAAFLRECFKTGMTAAQLRAACVERFGEERAPSVGRIGVFRQRARW